MYKKQEENNENFWISYADLMAGLLFVFILLIGAIIIKYLYTQTDLQTMRVDLEKEKKALNLTEEQLLKKKKQVEEINDRLKKAEEEKIHLSFELAQSNNRYEEVKNELQKAREIEEKLKNALDENKKELQLSTEQIEKITAILEDKNNNIELLNKQLQEKSNELNTSLEKIRLNFEEIDKLKDLLLSYELKNKDEEEKNKKLVSKLDEKENFIKLKDSELLQLEQKLIEQSKIHQKLVEEFDITKTKIKHLTGIKITVITKLKETLGDSINIDKHSGAIQFSSNILFDQGAYKLKDSSKNELKDILKKYMSAIFDNEDIKKYIERIIIEGHTNSDGTYLANLELSQQRALEVMKFLYESDILDKELLTKYVSASGRSYADRIYVKDSEKMYVNGMEDKNASRRIEIKFMIKNEAAIKEIQNYLDKE